MEMPDFLAAATVDDGSFLVRVVLPIFTTVPLRIAESFSAIICL